MFFFYPYSLFINDQFQKETVSILTLPPTDSFTSSLVPHWFSSDGCTNVIQLNYCNSASDVA